MDTGGRWKAKRRRYEKKTTTVKIEDGKGCCAGCRDKLSSLLKNFYVQVLIIVVFPLGLYLVDLLTDILLAVSYYNSRDYTWFGLTLAFILLPSIVMQVWTWVCLGNENQEMDRVITRGWWVLVLCVLQLGVFVDYWVLYQRFKRGSDIGDSKYAFLPQIHLVETMLEAVPQLCLQLYITIVQHYRSKGEEPGIVNISFIHDNTGTATSSAQTGGSPTPPVNLQMIFSVTTSLLAAVKALMVYEYYYWKRGKKGTQVVSNVLFAAWKIVEVCCRVATIALFSSLLMPYIALPIALHWVVMAVVETKVGKTQAAVQGEEQQLKLQPVWVSILAVAPIDVVSWVTFTRQHTVVPLVTNTILVTVENYTMVTLWYVFSPYRWYGTTALAVLATGYAVSVVLNVVYHVYTLRKRAGSLRRDRMTHYIKTRTSNSGGYTKTTTIEWSKTTYTKMLDMVIQHW
ncbi:PREDICTED: XK-related protein 6-like [Branchiostoma belcheri]|uniref:XK-related protein n=1 Tax=Branchiostoma belcheri TaxID=7741 RepID=A0A6P4XTB0_BRABE|nr:PREDICTED: XK-related protein 6-like [Branchiostoma belcheri]